MMYQRPSRPPVRSSAQSWCLVAPTEPFWAGDGRIGARARVAIVRDEGPEWVVRPMTGEGLVSARKRHRGTVRVLRHPASNCDKRTGRLLTLSTPPGGPSGRWRFLSKRQIAAPDRFFIDAEGGRAGAVDDPSLDHDRQPVGYLLGEFHVLLDQQDRHAALTKVSHDPR